MFRETNPHCFWSTTVSKHIPDKVLVDNTLITDPSSVLSTWAEYCESLSKSQISSSAPLTEIQTRVQDVDHCSFNDSDILDVAFEVEKWSKPLNVSSSKSQVALSYLSPEHLHHCGPVCTNWLCKVYYRNCELEQIPECFKHGIIIPAFKEKGRDPLLGSEKLPWHYPHICSRKALEILLLNQMTDILDDTEVPQLTQRAYRRNVGCTDSIFASQEVNHKFINKGDSVYSCYYNLEKCLSQWNSVLRWSSLHMSTSDESVGVWSRTGMKSYMLRWKLETIYHVTYQ